MISNGCFESDVKTNSPSTVTDDAIADSGEYYTLTVGGEEARGTINDETNDYDPSDDDQSNERDPGTELSLSGDTTTIEGTSVIYTVTATNPVLVAMDVELTITNVTTNGDITEEVVTVTIPVGGTTATYTVSNVDDVIKEPSEDYNVAITNSGDGGYEAVALGTTSITTTITDNDSVVVSESEKTIKMAIDIDKNVFLIFMVSPRLNSYIVKDKYSYIILPKIKE